MRRAARMEASFRPDAIHPSNARHIPERIPVVRLDLHVRCIGASRCPQQAEGEEEKS